MDGGSGEKKTFNGLYYDDFPIKNFINWPTALFDALIIHINKTSISSDGKCRHWPSKTGNVSRYSHGSGQRGYPHYKVAINQPTKFTGNEQ